MRFLLVLTLLTLCITTFVNSTTNNNNNNNNNNNKINAEEYLKKGYVISLIPNSHKEEFTIDDKEKHIYTKSSNLITQPPPLMGDGYYQFIPVFEATLLPSSPPSKFNTSCFANYSAQMVDFTEEGATVTITADKKKSDFCMDSMMVASRESVHFFDFFFEGTSDTKFKWTSSDEYIDIKENGFQIFFLPSGYLHSILDIWETYELFAGKHSFQDGIKFMEDHMNITFVKRSSPNFVPDESEILDGDYLAIFAPTNYSISQSIGVASLIAMGTGGHTSHTAICLRIDGVLYVVESCGKGIIKTEYATWMKGLGDEVLVSILRLREDLQAIFNATAAGEYFKTVEGLPYGDENFVFGWIDTIDGNYPPPLSSEEIPAVLVLGDIFFKEGVNIGVAEGLNQRLGTNNFSIPQIISYCDAKNISIVEVIAMPELDSYIYPNPPGPRMVCDVFAMKLYQAGGIFGDLEFEATELTPKDTYQLQIYSTTWTRPQGCANDATPGVCQISGMYWLDMPGFNSIAPYAHMNEKCSAVPVEYVRTPVGC